MTIEKTLQDLTEAVKELTSAIDAGNKMSIAYKVTPKDEPEGETPEAETAEEEKPKTRKRKTKKKEAASEEAMTYKELRALAAKYIAKYERPAIVALLAKLGVDHLEDLPQERYAEAVEIMNQPFEAAETESEEDLI